MRKLDRCELHLDACRIDDPIKLTQIKILYRSAASS